MFRSKLVSLFFLFLLRWISVEKFKELAMDLRLLNSFCTTGFWWYDVS